MSQPKFASVTADLLSRKGNAMPSAIASFPPFAQIREASESLRHSDLSAAPAPVSGIETPTRGERDGVPVKKLFVTLSYSEHERLAISAVKTGLTRHQIVRDALELYFEQLVLDLPRGCGCLSGTACSRSC